MPIKISHMKRSRKNNIKEIEEMMDQHIEELIGKERVVSDEGEQIPTYIIDMAEGTRQMSVMQMMRILIGNGKQEFFNVYATE